MKKLSILAIVPARMGSVRLPKKNISIIAGKPLLAWSIEAARKSGVIEKIIVSTENPSIAKSAERFGAQAPFLRPKPLATSSAKSVDVVLHALKFLETKKGYRPSHVMLLQPTSPLRTAEDIRAAVKTLKAKKCGAVVSVCAAAPNVAWTRSVDKKGFLQPSTGSAHFVLNGAIYLFERKTFLRNKTFYAKKTAAYIMPPERSVDIDHRWQMVLAEALLKNRKVLE